MLPIKPFNKLYAVAVTGALQKLYLLNWSTQPGNDILAR